MATGKNALDIFTKTTKRPDIGIEVTPRPEGRPRSEPYEKVTITLSEKQVLQIARVKLAVKERTGQNVARSELIRALLNKAAESLNPESPDFDKAIRDLFPILKG